MFWLRNGNNDTHSYLEACLMIKKMFFFSCLLHSCFFFRNNWHDTTRKSHCESSLYVYGKCISMLNSFPWPGGICTPRDLPFALVIQTHLVL